MPETATEAQKLLAEEAMKSFDFHAKDEQLAPEELAKVLHAAGLAVPLADVAALVDELTELEPTVERQKYQDAIVDRIMSTDPADKVNKSARRAPLLESDHGAVPRTPGNYIRTHPHDALVFPPNSFTG